MEAFILHFILYLFYTVHWKVEEKKEKKRITCCQEWMQALLAE